MKLACCACADTTRHREGPGARMSCALARHSISRMQLQTPKNAMPLQCNNYHTARLYATHRTVPLVNRSNRLACTHPHVAAQTQSSASSSAMLPDRKPAIQATDRMLGSLGCASRHARQPRTQSTLADGTPRSSGDAPASRRTPKKEIKS